ncbi:MAG: hypothetical protein QOG63_996 [Thermoleophilaceae bacterium]|nr:hypothetical protein [Thermoleophilaceae bacterium]
MRQGLLAAFTIAALTALLPATALAAPPPNDNRANAQVIPSLPATVDGTTVESTREPNEAASSCADDDGTVWYKVTTPSERRGVIVDLSANGQLDAVVDVFRLRRSRLNPINCATTDDNGHATLDFLSTGDETFLIRVAPLVDSPQDTFRLSLRLGEPSAKAPGPALPKRGATGTLDRVLNPNDAYSVRLRAGRTYRFNLASEQCTSLALYPPGTTDFESDSPIKQIGCRGYTLFTPDEGQSGRYSLLASAPRREGSTSYRLTAGLAGRDDIAPGRFLRNYERVKDSLNAKKLDVVDLYRFDVTHRSDLDLRLNAGGDFTITLLTSGGKKLGSESGGLTARLRQGRYFAVVKAARGEHGKYTLRRISRTITHSRTTFNGRGRATVAPGQAVTLAAHVRPADRGKVRIRVERFDPVAGWQFFRTYKRRTRSNGDAPIQFTQRDVGRWRARVEFLGSRGSSPSASDFAYLKVQRPLVQ